MYRTTGPVANPDQRHEQGRSRMDGCLLVSDTCRPYPQVKVFLSPVTPNDFRAKLKCFDTPRFRPCPLAARHDVSSITEG
jgi:hypothetical protein